jgi:hypothetical protein
MSMIRAWECFGRCHNMCVCIVFFFILLVLVGVRHFTIYFSSYACPIFHIVLVVMLIYY